MIGFRSSISLIFIVDCLRRALRLNTRKYAGDSLILVSYKPHPPDLQLKPCCLISIGRISWVTGSPKMLFAVSRHLGFDFINSLTASMFIVGFVFKVCWCIVDSSNYHCSPVLIPCRTSKQCDCSSGICSGPRIRHSYSHRRLGSILEQRLQGNAV